MFFIYLNLYALCKQAYLEKDRSCTHNLVGTAVLENIERKGNIRHGKKHCHNTERNIVAIKFLLTISDLRLKQIIIQEDHNIYT